MPGSITCDYSAKVCNSGSEYKLKVVVPNGNGGYKTSSFCCGVYGIDGNRTKCNREACPKLQNNPKTINEIMAR